MRLFFRNLLASIFGKKKPVYYGPQPTLAMIFEANEEQIKKLARQNFEQPNPLFEALIEKKEPQA